MSDKDTTKVKKPVHAMIALVVMGVIFVVGSGRLGFFSTTHLETVARGPYTIVGVEYIGSHRKIAEHHKTLIKTLQDAGLADKIVMCCAVLYDYEKKMPGKERRSLVGVVIQPDAVVAPPGGCILETLPRRDVLVASVRAHASLAYLKTKPKVKLWLQANNTEREGPTFVLYKDNGTVEVETPIANGDH